jgi:hypothetical protein
LGVHSDVASLVLIVSHSNVDSIRRNLRVDYDVRLLLVVGSILRLLLTREDELTLGTGLGLLLLMSLLVVLMLGTGLGLLLILNQGTS